jgi:hypothetical protein
LYLRIHGNLDTIFNGETTEGYDVLEIWVEWEERSVQTEFGRPLRTRPVVRLEEDNIKMDVGEIG